MSNNPDIFKENLQIWGGLGDKLHSIKTKTLFAQGNWRKKHIREQYNIKNINNYQKYL